MINQIKQNTHNTTTQILQNITQTGFASFIQNSEYQKLDGLEGSYFAEFLNDFFAGLSLDSKVIRHIKPTLLEIRNLRATDTNVKTFQAVYDDKSKSKLVSIYFVVEYNPKKDELNIVYTTTSTTQKLAPNLLVIKTTQIDGLDTKEQIRYVEKDRDLPTKDVQTMLEYFQVVALKKCSEDKSKMFIEYIEPFELKFLEDKEAGGLKDLAENINLVSSTWKSIVSAFKTTKTQTVKDKLAGKGFNKIAALTISDNVEGLDASMIDEYLNDFISNVGFPSDQKLANGLKASIKYTKFAKQKMFNGNNIVFNKGSGGQSVFITFLSRKNPDKTFDIIYSYYKCDFALAPDTWIINKGLSLLGGIFEDNHDYEKHVSRGLTDEDMKAVLAFGQLINLKDIYGQLGFPDLPLPQV